LRRSTHSSSGSGSEYWGRRSSCQHGNSKIDKIDATFRKLADESHVHVGPERTLAVTMSSESVSLHRELPAIERNIPRTTIEKAKNSKVAPGVADAGVRWVRGI